jgi:hypothetical protein
VALPPCGPDLETGRRESSKSCPALLEGDDTVVPARHRDRSAGQGLSHRPLPPWSRENFRWTRKYGADKPPVKRFAEAFGIKLREVTRPFYVAVSGSAASTPLFDSMAILGSDMVRVRLRRAIQALGGLSANQLKAAEKDYATKFGARQD